MSKVNFILDEAASLGNLPLLEDAMDKFRGYGVKCQFFYQDMGQLKKCWPEGREQTLLANCTQVFFGVNDPTTAEYVSTRLGDETIVVESGGSNWGSSSQNSYGAQSQQSSGQSDGRSSSWQPQARRLLKPEEVANASPRMAITFTPGVRPIQTQLIRYYEESSFVRAPGFVKRQLLALGMLCLSAVLCSLSLGLAALLTLVVISDPAPTSTLPRSADGRIEIVPRGTSAGRSGRPQYPRPNPGKVNHVRNR